MSQEAQPTNQAPTNHPAEDRITAEGSKDKEDPANTDPDGNNESPQTGAAGSQAPAEPPGEMTQQPTATQVKAMRPARPTPTKKRAPRPDPEGPELQHPCEKDFKDAVQKQLYEIEVSQLEWYWDCEMGQARSLNVPLANYYFDQLKSHPEPRHLIRVLVWQKDPSMQLYEEVRVTHIPLSHSHVRPAGGSTHCKSSMAHAGLLQEYPEV